MDTANDPRLAVAEKALEDLKGSFEHGHIKAQFPRDRAAEAVERGLGALKGLKYAYAEREQLVSMPQFNELMETVDIVETLLGGPGFEDEIDEKPLAVAQAVWAIDTLRSLEERIQLTGDGMELAVDVRPGRVVTRSKHPTADDLWVTGVAAGSSIRVVTNDGNVDTDDRIGVAMLPPTELHGVISRGMFLGDEDGVLTDVRPGPNDRPEVPPTAYAETRNMLNQYLDGR